MPVVNLYLDDFKSSKIHIIDSLSRVRILG